LFEEQLSYYLHPALNEIVDWNITWLYIIFIGVNETVILIFVLCKYLVTFMYVTLLTSNLLCYYGGLLMVELQNYCLSNTTFFIFLNYVILKVMDNYCCFIFRFSMFGKILFAMLTCIITLMQL
jgi:hypothetical protein